MLRRRWGPEQVAAHLRATNALATSHETIHRHIWRDKQEGGMLYTHLRGARKPRRKRYAAYDSRGRLAGKGHTSGRPAIADKRRQAGHWEIDAGHNWRARLPTNKRLAGCESG